MKKVAMIGCGKLGLPCAEVMSQHYDVVGYDVVKDPTAQIPMVDSLEEAVRGRDIIFIAVPTPHDPAYGGDRPIANMDPRDFDYGPVISVLIEINRLINDQQMVVLISTVLPGTTRKTLLNFLQRGRFVYNPYLIAMGSVKWDMVNPECLIIGTENGNVTGDAQELIDFYRPIMENDPVVNVGTWDEAEAIKIFYNTFISAKIGLVNMIQDVAEKNGNINVDVVTDALKKATQRITGPRYLTAGLGDAGACHPRDNIALRWLANDLSLGYDLFQAIMGSRDSQACNMAQMLVETANKYKMPVVIHGKAYKPYVPYTIGSYSMLVGHYVEHGGVELHYSDPLTGDDYVPTGPAVILMAHNPAITYAGTGVEIQPDEFYFKPVPGSIIVDPWRTITELPGCQVMHYGNPKQRKPVVNGAFLTPVYAGSISKEINDRFRFKLDSSQPAIYIANVRIECINSDSQASEFIKQIKQKVSLKDSDRVIFITQHEGLYAHGVMLKTHLQKYWPELKNHQYYYANELKSHHTAQRLANDPNSTYNHLNFDSIFEWVYPDKCVVPHDYENKKHLFLSYNRVLRTHRCQLVAELKKNNLIEGNLVSFVPVGEFYKNVRLTPQQVLSADPNLSAEQVKEYVSLLTEKLVIDEYDASQNGPTVADHYQTSILSVVAETTWNQGEIFISEKTYKAIAHGHPFILVAPAGTLQTLRGMGFKTFDGIIDESYDKIENHTLRLQAIVKELQRLSKLDPFARRLTYNALNQIAQENSETYKRVYGNYNGSLFDFLSKNANG